MFLSILSILVMVALFVTVVGLFLFVLLCTKSWGASGWTWLLGWFGSMRMGVLLIIAVIGAVLWIGYGMGRIA